MLDVLIYGGVALAAAGVFLGARYLAATLGTANRAQAQAAFAALGDFSAGDVLIYLNSAIAYDAGANAVAIWEKGEGGRRVAATEVGAWHSGRLLTVIPGGRTTDTPMVQLYTGARDTRPFFKVGVLNKNDCPRWSAHLAAAFGAEKGHALEAKRLGQ